MILLLVLLLILLLLFVVLVIAFSCYLEVYRLESILTLETAKYTDSIMVLLVVLLPTTSIWRIHIISNQFRVCASNQPKYEKKSLIVLMVLVLLSLVCSVHLFVFVDYLFKIKLLLWITKNMGLKF